MADWNSGQYLKFKKERTQPAIDLAARIQLTAPSRVIDIGCGPGNSTAVLKNRFPNADILGVDVSQNMLERAAHDHPDITFRLLDVSKDDWKLDGKFDVVFSNACMQWVPDHRKLLSKMMGLLNDGGNMAVQIPMHTGAPVHSILEEVSGSAAWRERFPNPRRFYTLTVEEYAGILADLSSDFDIWTTAYWHRLPSHEAILEWYKSTGLKPYLEVLDDAGQAAFLADIFREIKKHYAVQKNGEILFRFPRLFFMAVK